MPFIHTPKVAIATFVRGLVFRCWRRAVSVFANKTMNQFPPIIAVDMPIAATAGIWPSQAVVTFVGQDIFPQKPFSFAIERPTREGITMTAVALIMQPAHARSLHWLAAFFDRTYS